jgi:ribosomal protein L37AE/L43A
MNVDTAQTTNDYTRKKEEFLKDRKETHECFFCKKKGHIRKDCYQAIKAQSGGGSYTPRPAQNRVTEIVDDRSIIDKESYLNKDNFRDELMKLEEGARAEFLEDMLTQGFSLGPN